MTDVEDLIFVLKRVHTFKTYGGEGYSLEGKAAGQLEALVVELDALKARVDELLTIKHELNERLLEARAELQLKEAVIRERS